MNICYLLQGRDNPEIAVQVAIALSKSAKVVLTLNDDKARNEAYYTLVKHHNILLSTSTPFAQEGDLSSARCWLYQMKDALEKFDFDICVNLTEAVLPIKTAAEFNAMLDNLQPKNAIQFARSTDTDPQYAATMKRFFFSTNSKKFAVSEKTRQRARITADLAYAVGFRRKLTDVIHEGEPWFIFDKETAQTFSENLSYCTEAFLLGWYPERAVFQTMWKKFLNHKPIENACFVQTGEDASKAFFKHYDKLPERADVAKLLSAFEPSYEAPYDFLAEEIVEEDNRSMLQKTLDSMKKKK